MSSTSKGVGHKRPSIRLHSEIMSKRRHLQPSNAKRDSDKDSGFSGLYSAI
ncbi:UNVERIFIED_CONTAM: hypothetical protein FKN15_029392 [Acipenser sinensis]